MLKNALARTGHTRRGVPNVGGPYHGGHDPDGEIDLLVAHVAAGSVSYPPASTPVLVLPASLDDAGFPFER